MNNIPVINIKEENLPQAWEKAVLSVWKNGIDIKTQYDKKNDPPSKDVTGIITIDNPFNEPRIHKNFPGGPTELESYRQEVINGIHDHWINPEEGKWEYTYHERLFKYKPVENLKQNPFNASHFIPINQIDYIIESLSKSFYTRRAQGITWMPTCDTKVYDPPCLQRIWARIIENDNKLFLNMNTHWRSRDLYKAWFMNVYALTDLQKIIAEKISKKINKKVEIGRYVDISDSLHLYGSYFEEIEPEIKKMIKNPITKKEGKEQRTWNATNSAFEFMTNEAKINLQKDPDFYSKGND